MRIIEKVGLTLLVIGFLGFIGPGPQAAQQTEIKVNCNKGESVQAALDKLTGPATIVVTGTCHEYLTINKDDVSIQGGNYLPPPTPGGTIFVVFSARRVSITEVTVTGGNQGITVTHGGSLTLGNSTITEATSHGVVSNVGSSLIVQNCEIQNNGQVGAFVGDNSSLALTYCNISDNTNAGVLVQRSSSARIGVDTLGVSGPNTIENNRGAGVNVSRSAHAVIDGNTINGNYGHGINIEGSSATVTNNTISNSKKKGVIVQNSGSARIGITEGDQRGPNRITDNVYEGIEISNSASAYMLGNTIKSNGLTNYRPGVAISRATGRLIGENTIQNNGGHGVAVNLGALFQGVGDFNVTPPPAPDLITENGYSGISGWNGASLDIRHAAITNNTQNGIVLSLRSSLRIYDSIVSGHLDSNYHGIAVNQGSGVILSRSGYPHATITGNSGYGVFCEDSESSCAGDTTGVNGNGSNGNKNVNCTGF